MHCPYWYSLLLGEWLTRGLEVRRTLKLIPTSSNLLGNLTFAIRLSRQTRETTFSIRRPAHGTDGGVHDFRGLDWLGLSSIFEGLILNAVPQMDLRPLV